MSDNNKAKGGHRAGTASVALAALAVVAPVGTALAFDFDTGNPDLTVRWDNTIKYSNAWRTNSRSDAMYDSSDPATNVNTDDGNRNFDTGPVSNRLDLLTEMDVAWKGRMGVRASAAGWYDSVYNEDNNNDSPFTVNHFSSDSNEFGDETRDIMGRKIELLDAFGWGKFNIGESATTLRVGRHTLQYGETLFFGGNGIANAQGPIDVVKLLNVPSSQFKEVLRPVGQVSFDTSVNSQWSVGGYYQFEWDQTRLPPPGSFLSSADFVGEGGEALLLGPNLSSVGGVTAFLQHDNIEASNQGQGGFKVRWAPADSDYLFGFYGAVYHEKTPQLYFDFVNGQALEVFPEDIKTLGLSVTSSVGQLNWAAEVSWRFDAPLESDVALVLGPGVTYDNSDDPLYAVGDTMHANLSGIYVLQPTKFWEGGSVLAEVAWNYLMDCTENCASSIAFPFIDGGLDPDATEHAVAFRMIFEPAYFQVLPGLDVTIPIGLGYVPYGRSAAVPRFAGAVEHGGDFSVGFTGKYQQVWQFGLNYVQFIGDGGPGALGNRFTWEQALKDRSFISFNVRRSF